MSKLSVFNTVTLDGYFTGPHGDLSWAHPARKDPAWDRFVAGNARQGGILIFGRVTYEMMVAYWPTPQARADNPAVAEGMNRLPKVVFSRTLEEPEWSHTRLVPRGLVPEIRRLKKSRGPDMVILGSGSIVAQLAEEDLIDEYQLVVVPVVLGQGRTMFEGVRHPPSLQLVKSRVFRNGNTVLHYQRAKPGRGRAGQR